MKLLKPPETEVQFIDTVSASGHPVRLAGRTVSSDVEIIAPDIEDSQTKVWNRLKYGTQPDLRVGQKIDRLEFPGYILHGVIPYEQKRTNIWEGCVYKCRIDYYEEI